MKHSTILCAITISSLFLSSCSNLQEPETLNNDFTKKTRSDYSYSPHTLSYGEVMQSCLKVMPKGRGSVNATLKPLTTKNDEFKSVFLSDTIAYIVDYSDKEGYAIIPNDSRIDEVLAYSTTSNFSEENVLANHFFFDKIENYLASELIKFENGVSNNPDKAPVKHFVIDPQITIEIGPLAPFNSVVEKYHPDCHAGFSNVAAATIVSHLKDELIYKKYHYKFPGLIYALNNHLEQEIIPFINLPGTEYPGNMTFLYSYDGAVSAFSQLIYDIGVSSNTIYRENGYVSNSALLVMMTLKNMGFECTTVRFGNDINDVCSLLSDGYLINMFGTPKDHDGNLINIALVNGEVSWVIDGCDVMLNNNNEPVSGMVHVVWGGFGLGDGFYSFPILMQDENYELEQRGYYGVKSNN